LKGCGAPGCLPDRGTAMKTFVRTLLLAAVVALPAVAAPKKDAKPASKAPVVVMKTSAGDIKIELDAEKAPITVKNFLSYVDEKFYDGTIFHRVIDGFMIQGGGFTKDMTEKKTHAPIKNESSNGLKNSKYTLAMARLPAPDSASAQFFINVNDNGGLDYPSNGGYAVFGHVVSGQEVVDKIKGTKTGMSGPYSDVPVETVTIQSVRRAN
jgi:cyclophilin family peptidyl-prolyl cis-trans isomerase